MKRRALTGLLVSVLLLLASRAFALSGAGAVVAMKNGDFVVRYFNGTQAGIDSAVVYCTPGGSVQLGPGLEALKPTSPPPATVLVLRTGSAGWEVSGRGVVTPRLGPPSSASSGGAIRIVEGVTFPLTVAGAQAAIDECYALGGGEVWLPENANILLATTPVRIKPFVKLRSQTTYTGGGYTFTSNGSTNVEAAIMNSDTTGSQQYAAIEGISIWGGAVGARVDAGIKLKKIYVGSAIKDVLVTGVSGIGIRIEGDNTNAAGQMYLENVTVTNTGHYSYYFNASLRNIWCKGITFERPGRNTAGVFINGQTTTSGGNVGVQLDGAYSEITDSMSVGVLIDGAASVRIDNYTACVPSGRMRAAVEIKSTNAGNHYFSPSGLLITNLYAESDTLVQDTYDGVVVTVGADPNNPYRFLPWYTPPKFKGGSSTTGYRYSGQIIGIQPAKLGPDVASAATIAPHPEGGSVFTMTGTTTITTATGRDAFLYKLTIFVVTTALQFTDGGNLNLNGNFVGNATGGADLLGMIWDGSNWNEAFRSLN